MNLKKKDIDTTPEFTVIIAKSQTAGRGRFERKFHSPENTGIYMSILLRPDFLPDDCNLLTPLTAVAAAICFILAIILRIDCFDGVKLLAHVGVYLINGRAKGKPHCEA